MVRNVAVAAQSSVVNFVFLASNLKKSFTKKKNLKKRPAKLLETVYIV
ncbi:unnamed protein product [Arabidopsis halleri]